jgi:YaaC-like Protein
MDSAWNTLQYLETEPTARKFLSQCYAKKELDQSDRLAFQQSTRFLYLWKQARLFYHTAATADLSIQPLLLFYGCTHLLKGMLITQDPDYPQNSRVLQHGVTTRKVKRNAYVLVEDEIRPQKEGFFSHLARSFHLTPLRDRYLVHDLFVSLAEMSPVYAAIAGNSPLWIRLPLSPSIRENPSSSTLHDDWYRVTFPVHAEGSLAYSPDTLKQYVQRLTPSTLSLDAMHWHTESKRQLVLSQFALSQLEQHPLFYLHDRTLYFWNGSVEALPLPQWASHFLLLYLLGMLCRYETEWWGELTLSHDMAERFLVDRFLTHHIAAFPSMILKQIQVYNQVDFPF